MRETLGAPGQMGQQLEDKAFVRTATEDGIADVKLGQLAIQKGGPDVKAFAQKIVADHEAINKELATVADSLGVLLPKKMNKDDQAEYDKLNGLSGKDFDTEYIPFILKAHWKKLHDFYMEASVAVDPTLAATVVNAMRMMHDHLGMIAQVAKQDGIPLPPRPPRPGPRSAASEFTAAASRGEAVRESIAVCSLFDRCLFSPPPAIPPGGGWVRKLIVMWRPQGKYS